MHERYIYRPMYGIDNWSVENALSAQWKIRDFDAPWPVHLVSQRPDPLYCINQTFLRFYLEQSETVFTSCKYSFRVLRGSSTGHVSAGFCCLGSSSPWTWHSSSARPEPWPEWNDRVSYKHPRVSRWRLSVGAYSTFVMKHGWNIREKRKPKLEKRVEKKNKHILSGSG